MFRDGLRLSAATMIVACVIVALIILGCIFGAIALIAQRDIVNPQVRQNMTLDPAKTIADRQDFHNKLSEIISTDQNIIIQINQIERCEAQTPICSNDDTLTNNLTGVEQIRNTAINAYNAKAANPDDTKYLESWMPKVINAAALSADYGQAKTDLQTETNNLQTIYNKGV